MDELEKFKLEFQRNMDPRPPEGLKLESMRRRAFDLARNNTCSVSLFADHLYFAGSACQSNVATCTAAMVYSTTQTSQIFETTSFTGVGYGIRFAIESITIYTSASHSGNPWSHFTSMHVLLFIIWLMDWSSTVRAFSILINFNIIFISNC